MRTVYIILYVIAGLCFLAAAFGPNLTVHNGQGPGRRLGVNLVALGLLAWVLVPLIAEARAG